MNFSAAPSWATTFHRAGPLRAVTAASQAAPSSEVLPLPGAPRTAIVLPVAVGSGAAPGSSPGPGTSGAAGGTAPPAGRLGANGGGGGSGTAGAAASGAGVPLCPPGAVSGAG